MASDWPRVGHRAQRSGRVLTLSPFTHGELIVPISSTRLRHSGCLNGSPTASRPSCRSLTRSHVLTVWLLENEAGGRPRSPGFVLSPTLSVFETPKPPPPPVCVSVWWVPSVRLTSLSFVQFQLTHTIACPCCGGTCRTEDSPAAALPVEGNGAAGVSGGSLSAGDFRGGKGRAIGPSTEPWAWSLEVGRTRRPDV